MTIRTYLLASAAVLGSVLAAKGAEQPRIRKPPVGVPGDATYFDGRWYRVYLDQTPWPQARDKCRTLGGQLAVVPNEPTHLFIRELVDDRILWLGGFKKTEGLWEWVDGSPFKFKGWVEGEPNEGLGFKAITTWRGGWGDNDPKERHVVGYVCEWKDK
jgi:hypothetical protein